MCRQLYGPGTSGGSSREVAWEKERSQRKICPFPGGRGGPWGARVGPVRQGRERGWSAGTRGQPPRSQALIFTLRQGGLLDLHHPLPTGRRGS